ncbi:MAG: phytanoyl-CoA dioxygenase family protein [Rhodospirillales bacterium]|nr:phytanoyl-CoA dioxygenase family protein [Rhodospirillales bacterium]
MPLPTPVMTPDQIDAFKRDGYLVARNAFPRADVQRVEGWCRDLLAMPEQSGKHWVYWEPSLIDPSKKIVSRIENISDNHSGFKELTTALKGPVSQLLGEESVLFKEKVNFKMPGGDGFKPHQDSQAGWDNYTAFFINVLVAIDRATTENGCLEIAAGQHRQGLYKSWEPLTEKDMAGMSFVACPTEPGDLVFFDSYAPHSSKPNFTKDMRRLYYVTYNRLSDGDHMACYYADKHKSYPPDIDRVPGKSYVFRV